MFFERADRCMPASYRQKPQILAKEAETFSLEEISVVSAEMHKSAKNVLGLVNDLMQWARMSQGGMDFSKGVRVGPNQAIELMRTMPAAQV